MQTAAGIANALDQLTLDEAVHVLVRPVDEARLGAASFQHTGQCRVDARSFVGRQDPGAMKRSAVK